jgi:hypothetical protein
MIHFTCDMCGKTLLADEDTRYVVRVEVYAAYDPMEITARDLEDDPTEEIHDLLAKMDEMDADALEDQVYKTFRFDLCPSCHAEYIQDPLLSARRLRARFGRN